MRICSKIGPLYYANHGMIEEVIDWKARKPILVSCSSTEVSWENTVEQSDKNVYERALA